MTRSSDSDFVGLVFSALTTNTTHFCKVLRAIAPKTARGQSNGPLDNAAAGGDTFVLTTITADGIAFSVGEMHTGMGRLYLKRDLFSEYNYRPDKSPLNYNDDDDDGDENASVTFKLSLDRLIICLQMFAVDAGGAGTAGGTNNAGAAAANGMGAAPEDASTCRMIYQGAGHPFLLVFRQPSTSLVTTCEFNTLDLDPTEPAGEDGDEDGALRMDLTNVALQLIIAGRVMADAVSELKAIDTEILTLRAARTSTPRFVLLSHGKIGLSQFSFPEDTGSGKPLFERFMVNAPAESADPDVVVNSYTFGQILKAQDAMALATRVSIRCDAHGYMSIQSMYELGAGTAIFIDFRFCAIQDDDLTERLERLGYD
jgi:cell cycle checkpoint protein